MASMLSSATIASMESKARASPTRNDRARAAASSACAAVGAPDAMDVRIPDGLPRANVEPRDEAAADEPDAQSASHFSLLTSHFSLSLAEGITHALLW